MPIGRVLRDSLGDLWGLGFKHAPSRRLNLRLERRVSWILIELRSQRFILAAQRLELDVARRHPKAVFASVLESLHVDLVGELLGFGCTLLLDELGVLIDAVWSGRILLILGLRPGEIALLHALAAGDCLGLDQLPLLVGILHKRAEPALLADVPLVPASIHGPLS